MQTTGAHDERGPQIPGSTGQSTPVPVNLRRQAPRLPPRSTLAPLPATTPRACRIFGCSGGDLSQQPRWCASVGLENVEDVSQDSVGGGAAHVLYEQAHSYDWGSPAQVPHGFSLFGADETVRKLVPAPDGSFWAEHDAGLHFPAMETPAAMIQDPRSFFGALSEGQDRRH